MIRSPLKKKKFPGVDIDKVHKRKSKCKAKGCGKLFPSLSSLAKACSPDCAMKLVREAAAKADKLKWKERKKALETLPELKEACQRDFNKYIRTRDADKPCVSCGTTDSPQWDCGHYLSVGSTPELRFEPLNAAKQCCFCNDALAGNHGPYRIELIKRIGLPQVEWLETHHEPKHYTKDDLRILAKSFREKTRAILRVNRLSTKWNKTEELEQGQKQEVRSRRQICQEQSAPRSPASEAHGSSQTEKIA